MHARRLPPTVRRDVVAAFSDPGLVVLVHALGTDRSVAPAPIDADWVLHSLATYEGYRRCKAVVCLRGLSIGGGVNS